METRKFKDLTIQDAFMLAHIQAEKTMVYHSEYYGVRLDVYVAVF